MLRVVEAPLTAHYDNHGNLLGYDMQQVNLIARAIEVVDRPVYHVLRFMRAVNRHKNVSLAGRVV